MPKKQSFHIRNWTDYNEALVQRGSIIFWFDEEAISTWHPVKTTKKRIARVTQDLTLMIDD